MTNEIIDFLPESLDDFTERTRKALIDILKYCDAFTCNEPQNIQKFLDNIWYIAYISLSEPNKNEYKKLIGG